MTYRLPFAVELASVRPYEEGDLHDRHADFRAVFYSNARGMRVLQAILEITSVFDCLPAGDDMARFEGRRDVGVWLMQTIDNVPRTYSMKRQSEMEDDQT